MFYFLRIFITLLWAGIKTLIRRLRGDDKIETHFEMDTYVHVFDLDGYLHMNNAQYLSVLVFMLIVQQIFELARFDMMIKFLNGRFMIESIKRKWYLFHSYCLLGIL